MSSVCLLHTCSPSLSSCWELFQGQPLNAGRSMWVRTVGGRIREISDVHPLYQILRFPLIFPIGGMVGWHPGIRRGQREAAAPIPPPQTVVEAAAALPPDSPPPLSPEGTVGAVPVQQSPPLTAEDQPQSRRIVRRADMPAPRVLNPPPDPDHPGSIIALARQHRWPPEAAYDALHWPADFPRREFGESMWDLVQQVAADEAAASEASSEDGTSTEDSSDPEYDPRRGQGRGQRGRGRGRGWGLGRGRGRRARHDAEAPLFEGDFANDLARAGGDDPPSDDDDHEGGNDSGDEGRRGGLADRVAARVRGTVSCLEWAAYHLQVRGSDEDQHLLKCRKLLQEFMVDMYVQAEGHRLKWVRDNQTTLRAELYSRIQNSVAEAAAEDRMAAERATTAAAAASEAPHQQPPSSHHAGRARAAEPQHRQPTAGNLPPHAGTAPAAGPGPDAAGLATAHGPTTAAGGFIQVLN